MSGFKPRDVPDRPALHEVVRRLRAGEDVADDEFDALFPRAVQKLSRVHWTPLPVARRAVAMLAPDASARVLDVGSGAGKLCLVGALTTPGRYVGVDRDPALVGLAKELARRYGIGRVRFVAGDAADVDWGEFNAIYLYNPYAQAVRVADDGSRADADGADEVEYVRAINDTHIRLASAASGTRVVVFHGYGGERPQGYDVVECETFGAGVLELWVKR